MARTRRLNTVAAISAAVLMVLSGCSGDGDGGRGSDTGSGTSTGTAAPPPGRAADAGRLPWTGPPLPGLAATPAWSAPRDRAEGSGARGPRDTVHVVGGGVVIVHGKAAADSVAWFHDAKTGALRATVNLTGAATVETWGGRPALVTREQRKVPASGLTPERASRLVTAFDEQGRRIAEVDLTEADGFAYRETVVDGWVVRRGTGPDGKPHVWVRSADTPDFGPPKVTCGDRDKGCVEPGLLDTKSVGFALGTVFTTEYDAAASLGHVVATDAATGKRRWTTATLAAPPGTPADADAKDRGARAVVLGPVGDKILIGWYTNEKGDGTTVVMGRGPMLLGLYDVASGRLATPGPAPRVQSADFAYHVAPDGAVVYLSDRDQGGPHAVAWQVSDGRIRWRQATTERPLLVWQVVNGAAYAAAGFSTAMAERAAVDEVLVLNAADKTVIADPGPAGELIPQVTADNFGVVATEDRIWVFPPKPVS